MLDAPDALWYDGRRVRPPGTFSLALPEYLVPNIKAAIKWTRQSEKRRKRNLDAKTRLKTLFKKAKSSEDTALVSSVESQFDKAAQKGIIHPNKAARKKSRLAKAVRTAAIVRATAPAAPAARAAKARKKTGK
jgi:small subunit ribosomal protein S20